MDWGRTDSNTDWTPWVGAERITIEWDGLDSIGMEPNGMKRIGSDWNGTDLIGTERNGMRPIGTEWGGSEWTGAKWILVGRTSMARIGLQWVRPE